MTTETKFRDVFYPIPELNRLFTFADWAACELSHIGQYDKQLYFQHIDVQDAERRQFAKLQFDRYVQQQEA